MATMSFTWTLRRAGWVDCHVEDNDGQADTCISYITQAPEDFIAALTRLVLGATEQRVQFEAEPTAYRWIFTQAQGHVDIRLLEVPSDTLPDTSGTIIWTSLQPIDTLARTVIRAFDKVEQEHGEDGYHEHWRRPFPRQELEALRTAWRSTRPSSNTPSE